MQEFLLGTLSNLCLKQGYDVMITKSTVYKDATSFKASTVTEVGRVTATVHITMEFISKSRDSVEQIANSLLAQLKDRINADTAKRTTTNRGPLKAV